MIIGMTIAGFTLFHVGISLVALSSGIVAIVGMISNRRYPLVTAVFLLTTVLTSVTGFMFPFDRILPSHIFGIISLALLAVALLALYVGGLAGRWRTAYVVTAVVAFYLNAFVAVVQGFQKLPALQALAPTQSEPPFALAQGLLLVVVIALGWMATKRFARPSMPV